jgi:hypothetical protein
VYRSIDELQTDLDGRIREFAHVAGEYNKDAIGLARDDTL